MIKKYLLFLLIFTSATSSLLAQNYERYKILKDITLQSTSLGFEKKISVMVPIEWQKFNISLANSEFYKEKEKKDLEIELHEIVK